MISNTRLRQWHAYIGLFIAPSVLFFAMTGALQLFSLHESHGSYQPEILIEKLSAVHKDQVFEQQHDHHSPDDKPEAMTQPGGAPDQPPTNDESERPRASTLALKWFFLGVSVGLMVSTLIGLWMGITLIRRKPIVWTLIIAGALVPICLLAI